MSGRVETGGERRNRSKVQRRQRRRVEPSEIRTSVTGVVCLQTTVTVGTEKGSYVKKQQQNKTKLMRKKRKRDGYETLVSYVCPVNTNIHDTKDRVYKVLRVTTL